MRHLYVIEGLSPFEIYQAIGDEFRVTPGRIRKDVVEVRAGLVDCERDETSIVEARAAFRTRLLAVYRGALAGGQYSAANRSARDLALLDGIVLAPGPKVDPWRAGSEVPLSELSGDALEAEIERLAQLLGKDRG